ncbi:hypothetical protein B0A50_01683, partial [Salinomyces thailandicus]
MAAYSAPVEDAATLLETFTHDIASLPPELSHLLAEIQHKDTQIGAFREDIAKRDAQLQKWVRVNGGHVRNPKEEGLVKQCEAFFDRCELLQAEKEGLSAKALLVLERGIRRLDVGLRGLAAREEFPADWNGPSLLSNAGTGANTPVGSGGGGGNGGGGVGALRDLSGNIAASGAGAGGPNIANAAQMRLQQSSATAAARAAGQQTPTSQASARGQREGSADSSKRRRLNPSLGNLPAASSHLRQSSLGPGTPNSTSHQPQSRAGSAQPPRSSTTATNTAPNPKKTTGPPPHHGKKLAPPGATANPKKRIRTTTHKKADRRRHLARDRDRATPSTNPSNASDSDDRTSLSPTPSTLPRSQNDGTSGPGPPTTTANTTGTDHASAHHRKVSRGGGGEHDDEDDYEEENDDQLYCYCQRVSFGDMVGCDNDD